MQDSESRGRSSEQNDRLLSEFALTRRQSRSLYRNWAVLSKKSVGSSLQSQSNVFSKISSCSIGNDVVDFSRESSSSLIEDRADEIVRHMEQSQTFMDDNPRSNNERIETLREMTEYLTLKRSVKRKLIKSIGSTSKTLSFSKRLRYRVSIFFFKIPISIKHFLSSFELWYSSLKVIEGHFGSNVASYFKFLRKLFILNISILILMLFFVMVPQLLFRFVHYVDSNENTNFTLNENSTLPNHTKEMHESGEIKAEPLVMIRTNPYQGNKDFRLGNLFTGEGFLTDTILFYGYYTNSSLRIFKGHSFSIPASYFFTSAVCYFLIFLFLFISVAVSYRKCYIEASGGMKNTFTNKVLCGWDFGIATKQAAELKSKSIYIEIKELLDDLSKPTKKKTCANTFYTTAISLSLNGILLFLLGVGGMYSWKYLDQQMTKADTATTMMMWLVLTLVIAMAPVLFSLIAHLEGFESPSSALYMTLIRTFTLYAVVIAVVMAYRLNRSTESECWETILGQDMYRLVVLDFFFGLVGTAASEFIRYRIFIKMWAGIGCPEFDIARGTMNLIYNQTLFYIGLYFSPVLALVITIKLFLTFYIKKWGAIYNCKPFVKPWKASQAHTVYLSIAFLAFFCVIIAVGYIITSVKTSDCGPFRSEKYMYESLLEDILSNNDSTILTVFYYITRPGVVGIVLMAMVLGVYYMRAVALARLHVVNHLRHLLRLKAEDRKLLLNAISKYSKNQTSDENRNSPDNSRDCEIVCHRSQTPAEIFLSREGEHSDRERVRKSNIVFSSLTNLPGDVKKSSKSNRNCWNSMFNSVHNINIVGSKHNTVVEYKVDNEREKVEEKPEESSFAGNRTDRAESETSYFNDSTENSELNVGMDQLSYQSGLNRDSNEELFHVGHINFNPVFTESLPLESDEEDICAKNTVSSVRTVVTNHETPTKLNEEEEENNKQPSFPKVYKRFEERVPSRISFDFDPKDKKSKRKKRR